MNCLRETQDGDLTIVELLGKMDASTTPGIEARLLELIRAGNKYLALDFAGVTYLASSGLRMLLVVARMANALEGKLVLHQLDDAMMETLEMTGFSPYFAFAANRDEALRQLRE
jgi:anti-anti-sigma factor